MEVLPSLPPLSPHPPRPITHPPPCPPMFILPPKRLGGSAKSNGTTQNVSALHCPTPVMNHIEELQAKQTSQKTFSRLAAVWFVSLELYNNSEG